MAFTPTEEAQLRAVITAFESGKTISEIAASTEVFTTDVLEIVQSAVSKKATIAQIITLVNSQLGIAAISSKLSGIEAGAQVNVIESIVAGTNVTIDVTDPKNPIINVPVVNGEDGRGIVSRVLTSSIGLVDTYTTTYTDGTTDTYTVTNGTPGTTLTADQLQIINTVPLVCSDEKTDLAASTDVPVIRFVFQTAQSFTKIVGELNTAAAGGTFTVVAKKNGVSFLSTPLTFDGGENTTRTASVPFVFTTPTVSFSVGDYVEIFTTAIGAVTPGKGLKIYLM